MREQKKGKKIGGDFSYDWGLVDKDVPALD